MDVILFIIAALWFFRKPFYNFRLEQVFHMEH